MAMQGMYLEDFGVGQQIETPAHTVTEDEVLRFAQLSGDSNPLHVDPTYAAQTPFGQRIAHGVLGLSLATGLAWSAGFMQGTVQAFTGLSCKFKGPIYLGDTIRLRARVARTRALPSMGGGMLMLDVALVNQHDEVVQQGEWSLLVASRPPASAT